MRSITYSFLGGLFVIGTGLVAGLLYIKSTGLRGQPQPGRLETLVVRTIRGFAVPSEIRARTNPLTGSENAHAKGLEHYARYCALCHGNNGNAETSVFGRGLFPKPPDLRAPASQSLTDGELFYIIQNGVRLTGMPAWGSGSEHDTQDSWKLVRFIRHLPKLSTEEEQEMEQMNPKTPDELKEEQEEREFLNGGKSHEYAQHEHH